MHDSAQMSPVLTPFGKYLLDEEIARGGMARVYLARLRGLGGFEKKLVVKQVRPELASDPRFVEMFVEEAKTLVQMSHPHIVPVYELGIVDGVYFLAMEHVDGATLAEILRAEGPLAPPLVAHLGVSVCDALEYAHARFELVHRDVTPRNVIVDGLGHVRLLDFGIAARADGMLAGEVFGSHGYMSPEQARGEALGPASDLFSLAAVLHETLLAEPAFLRAENEQTRAALEGEPPSLSGRDDVPVELARLLDEMLQRDPSARPRSASEVGKRLRGWLASARPEGVGPELAERADAARQRRERAPSSRPPPPDAGRRDPSGVVRSIATSVTLQQLLDEGETQHEGTVPIEGRRSGAPAQARTTDAPQTGAPAAESGAARPATERPAPASRVWWLAGAVLVAGALAVSVAIDRPDGESARDAETTVAMPPGAETATGAEQHETATATGAEQRETATATGAEQRETTTGALATVSINSTPWSTIHIDGRAIGITPVRSLRVPPGAHVLALRNEPTGIDARIPIRVEPGATITMHVDLSSDPPVVSIR